MPSRAKAAAKPVKTSEKVKSKPERSTAGRRLGKDKKKMQAALDERSKSPRSDLEEGGCDDQSSADMADSAHQRRQSKAQLYIAIANAAEVSPDHAKRILKAIPLVAAESLRQGATFKFPGLLSMRNRIVPARPAGVKKNILGKVVTLGSRSAGTKVAIRCAKEFSDRCLQ